MTINNPVERAFAVRHLRAAARALFEDVDLDLRDEEWVDSDSYDAGLVAAAKYLLQRADAIQANEANQ